MKYLLRRKIKGVAYVAELKRQVAERAHERDVADRRSQIRSVA